MKLKFLGGAGEVGKSAILAETAKEKFIMDYGIEVQDVKTPIRPPPGIDAVFVTHTHIDHSGFVPNLYSRGYQGRVFATPVTFSLMHMLLEDSIKVQHKRGIPPGFSGHDIKLMGKKENIMNFNEPIEIGSSTVEFLCAGHIPGAASVSIKSRGKSLLYTGDIKFEPTKLMMGANVDVKDPDVIISESTYSYKDHPDRGKLTKRLLELIEQTCHNGGITILPAFAVGRTQELLVTLRDIQFPVYMDGMGIRATERILSYPDSFLRSAKLDEAFGRAVKIKRNVERKRATKRPGVIITTSGMLSGGPVVHYIKELCNREDSSMVLTGYQVDGTPGRTLVETGKYINEGLDVKPKFRLEFLDMSAHTDRSHLISFFKKANPGKIMLVHGDRTQEFSEELRGMGFDAFAPENGQVLSV